MYFINYHHIMKLNPIIARFYICKYKIVDNLSITKIAKYTKTHRNTISNILNLFNKNADDSHHQLLSQNLSHQQIIDNFSFLAPKSRKPLSNKRSASYKAEKYILFLALSN